MIEFLELIMSFVGPVEKPLLDEEHRSTVFFLGYNDKPPLKISLKSKLITSFILASV